MLSDIKWSKILISIQQFLMNFLVIKQLFPVCPILLRKLGKPHNDKGNTKYII